MKSLTATRLKTSSKQAVKDVAKRLGLDIEPIGLGPATFDRTVFGEFRSSTGVSHALYAGYRNYVKRRWRLWWWPLSVLYGLRYYHKIELPADIKDALRKIQESPALPYSLESLMEMVRQVHRQFPKYLYPDMANDQITWETKLFVIPTQENIREYFENYAGIVNNMLSELHLFGFDVRKKRTLEVGCGTGMCSLFLSTHGTEQCVGLDVDMTTSTDRMRDLMSSALSKRGYRQPAVRLCQGNIQTWQEPASSYDLAFNISVMEHIHDVGEAFKNIFRLLKPGGFAFHNFGLWFNPFGGHALNSYDFPWGHVRLSRSDLVRYLDQWRPHEKELALDNYDHSYNQPRLTLSELEDRAVTAGFEVVRWKEQRHSAHTEFLTSEALAQAKAQFPAVTARDLLTHDATVILRKP